MQVQSCKRGNGVPVECVEDRPQRLSIEEIAALISGAEASDGYNTWLCWLRAACLRGDLPALHSQYGADGRELIGDTFFISPSSLRTFLQKAALRFPGDAPISSWLRSGLSRGQADKHTFQTACDVAWEINPDWSLTGPQGVIELALNMDLLSRRYSEDTLKQWGREVRAKPGRAGRPRNVEPDYDMP